jgi:hypothetical protein
MGKLPNHEEMEKEVKKYFNSAYKTKYPLERYGIWDVHGDDENCDLGGSHIRPFLGRFEGRFIDVLRYAVTMPRWRCWGQGDVRLSAPVKKLTPADVIDKEDLVARIKEKQAEVDVLKKELGSLEEKL